MQLTGLWLVVDRRHGAALFAGAALLLLGRGLRGRRVVAWLVVAALLLGVVALHRPLDRWTILSIAVLAVLASCRGAAQVQPGRERSLIAGRLALLTVACLLAVGLGALLLGHSASVRPPVGTALHEVTLRLLGGDGGWPDTTALVRSVGQILPVAAALVVLALLAVLLSPVGDAAETDPDVHRRVAALCAVGDSDSLAPFSRRHDKAYVFSPDRRAVVGYRVVLGVCVAGPGPVGHADAHAAAWAEFVRRCDERGWKPAMIGASDEARQMAAGFGLHGVQIGDEALLPVLGFRLDRPPMRNVRQAVQRTRNSGVSVTVHREGVLEAELRSQLVGVAREWQHGDGELGFAMTLDRLLSGAYPEAVIFVAHHDGRPVGFQRYLVCRDGRSLSLDVMPRLRRAPNGVNERLIVEAVGWAARRGIHDVSLNFAAFRSLFEAERSAPRRVLRRIVHLLDPFINVESLYRFNSKFQPVWNARHVLYRSPFDLPSLLLAALRLEFRGNEPAGGDVLAPAHLGGVVSR